MGRAKDGAIAAKVLSALAEQIGVTRVARVTGLDRGGVEVACAVRPGGHVLQVSNGKGLTLAQARAGAVLEAAELWAAERPAPSQLIFATLAELEERGLEAWPLEEELLEPALFTPHVRIAWLPVQLLEAAPDRLHANRRDPNHRDANDHGHGEFVFIPASIIHCVPSSGPWLGPALHRWTSNGMGAHPDGELALRHALLEAAERDGLARALPEGWTMRELRKRKLDPSTISRAAPRAAALIEQLASRGLSAHLFDLRPAAKEKWMELSLAGALLIDDEEGPNPLAAGYACAPDRDRALLGALLEAAQSRLTDVHGAREDIAPADREAMRGLAQAASSVKGTRAAGELPQGERAMSGGLAQGEGESSGRLVARFAAAGFPRVAALDLAPPSLAARVVKVVVPGFFLSELL